MKYSSIALRGICGALMLGTGTIAAQGQTKSDPPKTAPAKAEEKKKTEPVQAAKPAPPIAVTAVELNRRAQALIDQGKVQDAVPLLQQAIMLDAKNIQSWIFLGRADALLQKFPEATKAFQTAVNLNPTEPEFLYYLGSSQLNESKTMAARSTFARALELAPSDIRFRLGISDAYMQEKEYPATRRSLTEALGYAGDSSEIHSRLGDLDEQENRHEEALEEYDAALRADPKNSSARFGRASALSGLKRFVEAEKIAREEMAKDPKSTAPHSLLAQILDAEGKHLGAIAEYKIALAAEPNGAILWGNLGWVQYQEGLMDDSITSGRKALAIDPKQPNVRFNLGLAYAVRDQWAQAQKEYAAGVGVAAAPEIEAASTDLRDAITKGRNAPAVKLALDYLAKAELKILGLEDDVQSVKEPAKRAK